MSNKSALTLGLEEKYIFPETLDKLADIRKNSDS